MFIHSLSLPLTKTFYDYTSCGALICTGENALWNFDWDIWGVSSKYASYQLYDYLLESGFSEAYIYQLRWAYKKRWSFTGSGMTEFSSYFRSFYTNELSLLLPVLSGI